MPVQHIDIFLIRPGTLEVARMLDAQRRLEDQKLEANPTRLRGMQLWGNF